MSNFVDCDRDQAFLLPPDLRDWIPSDDLAHFVIEAVERVDLGAFKVNHRGTGSAQYHPRMMLALLIYCYANGIFSSRRIERATHRDIGVRFIAANLHSDHDTIARFRRENFAAVGISFPCRSAAFRSSSVGVERRLTPSRRRAMLLIHPWRPSMLTKYQCSSWLCSIPSTRKTSPAAKASACFRRERRTGDQRRPGQKFIRFPQDQIVSSHETGTRTHRERQWPLDLGGGFPPASTGLNRNMIVDFSDLERHIQTKPSYLVLMSDKAGPPGSIIDGDEFRDPPLRGKTTVLPITSRNRYPNFPLSAVPRYERKIETLIVCLSPKSDSIITESPPSTFSTFRSSLVAITRAVFRMWSSGLTNRTVSCWPRAAAAVVVGKARRVNGGVKMYRRGGVKMYCGLGGSLSP